MIRHRSSAPLVASMKVFHLPVPPTVWGSDTGPRVKSRGRLDWCTPNRLPYPKPDRQWLADHCTALQGQWPVVVYLSPALGGGNVTEPAPGPSHRALPRVLLARASPSERECPTRLEYRVSLSR